MATSFKPAQQCRIGVALDFKTPVLRLQAPAQQQTATYVIMQVLDSDPVLFLSTIDTMSKMVRSCCVWRLKNLT